MRLTALCVCGTLLALSSLSWIRAEEGVLLGNQGFGPCVVTLRPMGACRLGQNDRTCPYLLSLPPLTVHLPHLRELENIMQDIQKLKDSVDELREMCADCTKSHTEKECGRQREREREKQTEGKSTHEAVRNWMNVRLEETDRGFKEESRNDGIKVEEIDGDNCTEKRLILEEDDRNKWETDRSSNKGVVKENEGEETLTEVEEKDGKTKKDGAGGKDQKMEPTAGGNMRTVDATSEKVFEIQRNSKDAPKGNLKGFQVDKLENSEDGNILKTKEESNIFVWQVEVNKVKKTEASDRTKMSENREDHINKERGQHEEETTKEMEKGIKVSRNNEKPKQSESPGHTERERTIKEGGADDKGREMGTEIKAESVQRDGDGELSSKKTTERTDFLSISPTPLSTTRVTSRPDSNQVTIFTSSLPSPPVSGSTLSPITDVSHETKGVYGLTKSSEHGADDVSDADPATTTATRTTLSGNKQEMTSASTRYNSGSTEKPGAGHDHDRTYMIPPTTTTVLLRVPDHSRWKPKQNMTVLKPPPGRGLKPGQKHKPGIKPEAEQKLKNPKNDRKPNQAPSPDRKVNSNLKQKPSHKAEKSTPGKDSKQIPKPDQRSRPYILATDKNLKINQTHSQNVTLPNKLTDHKPSVQKTQRPQSLNTTNSDKYPSSNKDHKSDDQNSKPEKKLVHPFKTKMPEKTPESKVKPKPKPNEKLELNQHPKPGQKPDSKKSKTGSFSPKPNKKPLTGSKPGLKITSNQANTTSSQMNKTSLEIPQIEPKLVREPEFKSESVPSKPKQKAMDKSDKKPLHKPGFNPDLKPAPKTSVQPNVTSDQRNKPSQEMSKIKHKPKSVQKPGSKSETATLKPNQKALTEIVETADENIFLEPESNPGLIPRQTIRSELVNATSDQMPESSREIPEIKHKPKVDREPDTKREPTTPKHDQKPLTVDKSGENSLDERKSIPDLTSSDRVNATSDQMNKSSQEMSKFKHKPKPIQESESTSETATQTPNQHLLRESVQNSDKTLVQEPESNPDVKSGKKTTFDRGNATSVQMNKVIHESPKIKDKPKPAQKPKSESETETTKTDQKTLTDPVKTSDKSPSQDPESKPDLISEKKTTFDQVNAASDPMNTPIQQSKPLQESESETKTASSKPDQTFFTESVETSDENSLQVPESKPDLKSGSEITFDQGNATSVQMNKFILERPKSKDKPKSESKTTSTKSNQQPVTESVETSEKNPLLEPESHPDLKPGKKTTFDKVNATSDSNSKSNQEISKLKPKPAQKPESGSKTASLKPDQKILTGPVETSDKNLLVEPESKPDLKSGSEITFDQGNATSVQMNKFILERPKSKDKPTSESKTTSTKSNQQPVTDSVETSEKNPLLEPESHPDLKPGKKTTFDKVNATSDSNSKSNQEISKLKPKPAQKPESGSKTASLKPDQKILTDPGETSDKNLLLEPESKPDLISEKKTTIDQINPASDPMNTPIQQSKPLQESESETKTASSKPDQRFFTDSVETSDENSLQEPESKPDLKSGKKMTFDQVNATSDQTKNLNKSNTGISKTKHQPEPEQEPGSKHETATSQPEQKAFTVDTSGKKPPHLPTSVPDSTPGQKLSPDLVNATSDQKNTSRQEIQKIKPEPKKSESESERAELKPNRKPPTVEQSEGKLLQEPKSNQDSTSGQTPTKSQKPSHNVPKVIKKPKPGPEIKPNQKHPKVVADLKNKPNKTSRPDQMDNLKPKSLSGKIPTAKSNRTTKPRPPFQHRPPIRPFIKPGAKPIQRPRPPVQPKPNPKVKTHLDPPKLHGAPSENIQTPQTDPPSTSGFGKQIAKVTHSPGERDISSSKRKTITLGPKTSNSLRTGHFPRPYAHAEDFTLSPNSRTVSDLRPQTASQPPSIPMTTRPNKINRGTLHRVITSTSPGSTHPYPVPKPDTRAQAKNIYNGEKTAPATQDPSSSLEATTTRRPDFRSTTSTTSGPDRLMAEPSTPSARELRVKINQVAAFVDNSLHPNGRPVDGLPKVGTPPEGSQRGSRPDRTNSKLLTSKVTRDCSDHLLRGRKTSGVYLVTPDLRSRSFEVFCDMEQDGGGWTLLQRRQDGSVSFNRSWVEYQSGFGELDGGEFWLGNNKIHLLTRDRDMVLRVELEDFEGVTGHAQYEQFRVAGERLHYRLTVGGYSGTAGDALRFSERYDHNNRAFSTPDRDHDKYPSGNCGAYYSSGWWFDACFAANLNGRYYAGKYYGVRDGIFWGTWYNITEEYYPTNERQSFKSVRMMIRPKSFVS